MFTFQPIGFVSSPYRDAADIPKGLGAKHDADGVLNILPEFEVGLTDIEGFSHLFIVWVFDRSEGYELLSAPPSNDRPHGVFATRSPRRPNPIGLTVVELLRREGLSLHVRSVDMLDGTPVLDSSPTCPAQSRGYGAAGWRRLKRARKHDACCCRYQGI
jgi:tRNA-Thr(GGU) m(6)t(6)A37 methyltransferase TsaA